ncbi:MAG: hypothetical protein WDZ96_03220 [Acidimicrobiia bacterium]
MPPKKGTGTVVSDVEGSPPRVEAEANGAVEIYEPSIEEIPACD